MFHVVEKIQKGLLTASDFTPMNVVRYNGILLILYNICLWVFRRDRFNKVTMNIASSSYSERSWFFFMSLDDQLERANSTPLYYPCITGRVRSSIFNHVRVSNIVFPSSSQPTVVIPPSSLLCHQSTNTSSSWNTHIHVHVHSSSSVGSWISHPTPYYTRNHSRDSNSQMNENF